MKSKLFPIVIGFLVLLQSCSSDDDVTGTPILSIDQMVGIWDAISAEFTSLDLNPPLNANVIANGGTGVLEVSISGRFSLVITPNGEDPQITTGLFSIGATGLEVVLDSDPSVTLPWGAQLGTTTMFLQGDMTFDFQPDGVFDAASAELNFIRR